MLGTCLSLGVVWCLVFDVSFGFLCVYCLILSLFACWWNDFTFASWGFVLILICFVVSLGFVALSFGVCACFGCFLSADCGLLLGCCFVCLRFDLVWCLFTGLVCNILIVDIRSSVQFGGLLLLVFGE